MADCRSEFGAHEACQGRSAFDEDEMSVTGSRAAAEINLDEFERRLRAAGAQPAGSEDPLFELARLVESSRDRKSDVYGKTVDGFV